MPSVVDTTIIAMFNRMATDRCATLIVYIYLSEWIRKYKHTHTRIYRLERHTTYNTQLPSMDVQYTKTYFHKIYFQCNAWTNEHTHIYIV